MREEKRYDAAVIGGGLAGLCFSVLMAKQGYKVILFEKETYPFQKVCGEYISMESRDFLLHEIGVPLTTLNLPVMKSLLVSAPNGNMMTTALDTGGFGISRFLLDNLVKEIAEKHGVKVKDGCKVDDVIFGNDFFTLQTHDGVYTSVSCCGAWGKRSNIDIKKNRGFTQKKNASVNNYVGIKYHVKGDFPGDQISLHNFRGGYCGLSKIEDDKFCLCYFMKASNLEKSGHAIADAERKVLSENPRLKQILAAAEKINTAPVTISQVSLGKKKAVEDHILMLGDAAGMISPLCGNGMSIAMHSAKIAARETSDFLQKNITRGQYEINYAGGRKKVFGKRIAAGRIIQSLFGREILTNSFLWCMKRSRTFARKIISLTHGKSF